MTAPPGLAFRYIEGGQAPRVLARPFWILGEERPQAERCGGQAPTGACPPLPACKRGDGRWSRPGASPPVSLPVQAGCKQHRPPASPVSHASRYNTLHLASKIVCQGGARCPPLETPGFVGVWPQTAILRPCPNPSKNTKEAAQTSPPHRLICAASLFGLRAGTGEKTHGGNCVSGLQFSTIWVIINLTPNRRLQYERSGVSG